jgi:hypothetical protein
MMATAVTYYTSLIALMPLKTTAFSAACICRHFVDRSAAGAGTAFRYH